jgi:hypothetical protein
LFIIVQIKHALYQNIMLNKNDKMHDYTNKFASNMYKLNKDINRVYKSLVHKIYHATTQRNSNKLHELQF